MKALIKAALLMTALAATIRLYLTRGQYDARRH